MRFGMKALSTVGALIATYLLVANATGAGNLMARAGTAGSGIIKSLQGR
jgi:hypothetical protein